MGKRKNDAGVLDYIKEAFLFRWNLLFALGAGVAAAISPAPEILLPLVAAGELAYLVGMTAMPRFRQAIDAKIHHRAKRARESHSSETSPHQTLESLVEGLSHPARRRFENLRRRCLSMKSIARGVGGRATRSKRAPEEISNPGLDRLLWVFLRLLYSQTSLERFLAATDEDLIRNKLDETNAKLQTAEQGEDQRMIRSLRDSLATRELQLENYRRAQKNAEFVAVELDRLEGKIQTLSEVAVNRQDPDFISREVDSVAASMQHTEEAMEELHLVDGLLDNLAEPPSILEADLDGDFSR